MLLVIDPLAFVAGSVAVGIVAMTLRLVIFPVAVVNIAIRMYQASLALGLVVSEPALVYCSILPDLAAPTLANVGPSDPLSFVSDIVVNFLFTAELQVILAVLQLLAEVCLELERT